jgi:hypothetical protein
MIAPQTQTNDRSVFGSAREESKTLTTSRALVPDFMMRELDSRIFKGCAQDRTEPSNYRRPSLDEKEEVDSERIATRSDGKSGRLKLQQLFHP